MRRKWFKDTQVAYFLEFTKVVRNDGQERIVSRPVPITSLVFGLWILIAIYFWLIALIQWYTNMLSILTGALIGFTVVYVVYIGLQVEILIKAFTWGLVPRSLLTYGQ